MSLWNRFRNWPLRGIAGWGAWLGLAATLVSTAGKRHGLAGWWQADKGKLVELVESCWWWGGLAVAVLGLVLLGSARWWARTWPAVAPGTAGRAPRWLLGAVGVLMLAGLAVRAPRLGLSLYNDECHVFRAQLAGEVPRAHWGNPDQFRPVKWLSTLYENRAGNNAMPFSILSRLSYDSWRARSGAPPGRVNETALRLPVLVCGVLAIGAMAWLGWRLGGPGMALLAALLTTFHPWHMRYSVEARGYGILMLLLPLGFVALDAALRSGRWRHWLLFGVLQYLVLACWFGSSWLLLAVHLFLAGWAAWPALPFGGKGGGGWSRIRWNLLVPAVLSGVLALGLYLQINLAHFVQLSKALADPGFFKSPDPFPAAWFQDVGGFLAFGIPGLPVESIGPASPTVAGLWTSEWGLLLEAGGLLWIAGLLAGTVRMGRIGPAGLAVAAGTFGGAFLTWAYCTAKGILFLKWYPLFLLPGLLLLMAAGLDLPGKGRRWVGWFLALPLLAAWAPGLSHYARYSRQNLRGVVEMARSAPYPLSLTNPNQSLYGNSWSESPIYEPSSVTLPETGDLHALMDQALRENRPLHVTYGYAAQARIHAAGIVALLEDPARFRLLAVFPGLDEPSTTQYLYQFIPTAPAGSPPAAKP